MDVATASTWHSFRAIDRLLAEGSIVSIQDDKTTWLILGLAMMGLMYFIARPKKRKDPLAAESTFRPSLAHQQALERDMQNVIVELSEFTRQMSAQLETRAAKLEQIIADADQRLAALEQARAAFVAEQPKAESSEPKPAMRLVKESIPKEPTDRWNEVYELADRGATLPDICRQLNRPRGEVELILALRPKPRAAAEQQAAVG